MPRTALTLWAQAADGEQAFNVVEVGAGLAGSALSAVVAIYAVRAQRKDPLDRRKAELEIMEKELALGLARENKDIARIAELTVEPLLERRRTQDIIVRFVLLYLVLRIWGMVGGLFAVGLGTGLGEFVAIIPQTIRALIFVSLGWPLLLDTTRLLDIALPDFMYRSSTKWLLVAVAALSSISGQLLSGLFYF